MDESSDAPGENNKKQLDEYLRHVSAVFDQFFAAKRRHHIAIALEIMSDLKGLLRALRSLPPSRERTPTDRELTLARDIYEWAALITGQCPDPAGALISAYDELKPYYSDEWKTLPWSGRKDFLFRRYLVALVEKNEFDKFRNEVQSLSDRDLAHPMVAYAVRMEKLLSEQAAREKTLADKGIQETGKKLRLRNGHTEIVMVRTPAPAHPPFDLFMGGDTCPEKASNR